MTGLTRRESRVLEVIEGYVATHGYSPSIAELTGISGLSSTSSISYILDRLEAKGRIKRTRHVARSIALIPQPEPAS